MRYVLFLILVAVVTTSSCASVPADELVPLPRPVPDDVRPLVRLPDLPPDTRPEPRPVDPVPVTDLRAGELFVIASEEPCRVEDSRQGIVSIKKVKGPREFYSKFVDGKIRGEDEERVYNEPFLYVIKAVQRGTVELLITPRSLPDDEGSIRRTLTVMGQGPQPPPDPDVVPVPPGPVTTFRVIFVKESGATLPSGQTAIPAAKAIRDYLTAKTTPEGGFAGWREYDPDQVTVSELPTMRALWETVKPKVLAAPCLVIEVNGKATVMPFPANVNEALAKLKEYGGA